MNETGDVLGRETPRVNKSIVAEYSFDCPVVHANIHDALGGTGIQDFTDRSKLNSTPLLPLVIRAEKHHYQLGPVAINGLKEDIERRPRELSNIVVIVEVAVRPNEMVQRGRDLLDILSRFARK